MYDPPAYVWALTISGPTAIAATTCIVLYGGVVRAGLGRRRAALLGGAAAVLLGGWFAATAVIAGHGCYDTRSSQVPWLPIAAAGSLGALLAASWIPMAARALTAPGMASRLVLPHAFRVTGVFFLLYLALGHLPTLFALQAGLGDIAAGMAAPLVARRLAQGTGRRGACGSTCTASPIWSRASPSAPSLDTGCSTSHHPVPRSANSRSRWSSPPTCR
jgi:hypothetical protein